MEVSKTQTDATLAIKSETEKDTVIESPKKMQMEAEDTENMAPDQATSHICVEGQSVENTDSSGKANAVIEVPEKNSEGEEEKATENVKEGVSSQDEGGKYLEIDSKDTKIENKSEEESDCNKQKEALNGETMKEHVSIDGTADVDSDNAQSMAENKSIQTPSTDSILNKKAKKKDKSSAEEKKLVDLLVHVFDGLETPEKKMEALAKKYIQLAADMKTTESKLEDVEGKHREIKREKEQLQHDFSKVNMAKTKLESLCRELQKQNKIIKEEIQKRSDEEDRKRRELSQKFQSTINDITTQMGENHKRNQQLKQDNTDLAQKLKGLVEQYEVREQHIEKVLKAKQLELQLCEAKLQQQSNILQEERQNHLKEKHALLTESLEQEKKVELLVKQEAELKGQLSLYTEKFVEFQSTLTKSNEVFATFKKEMDKMTKTIRKLEKESNTWKTRYENTNVSLVQMVEERTQRDNDILLQKGKIDKLEKLCRALQAERRKLKKELEKFDKPSASESSNNGEKMTQNEENGPCKSSESNLSEKECLEIDGIVGQEVNSGSESPKHSQNESAGDSKQNDVQASETI